MDQTLAQSGGWVEILRVPAALFGGVLRVRRFLFDHRLRPVLRVSVPVLSVGNVAVGGTGKTPMVVHLVRHLRARGLRVGVLARGYGRAAQGTQLNEEGAMLQARFPDLLQVQDRDRVRGALSLIDQGAQCIVLDDGFQHRRLFRELDVVLVDATRPFGLPAEKPGRPWVESVLPRGFLREPLSALSRAQSIVLTRTRQSAPETVRALEERLRGLAPGVPIAWTDHRATALWQDPSLPEPVEHLRGQRVDLVSGFGNPQAFEASVRALGMTLGEHRVFQDHHAYQSSDLEGLGANPVVTTAKDFPKLQACLGAAPWKPWVLDVELEWIQGQAEFEALLEPFERSASQDDHQSLHAGLHG
ncbi:MAG TPA: tetraacyldisaccharide 4'-kinase [Planctomycetota bacterium]|nr:tetraacyldisaccharide 4'-kinase [Planctomycetota bacterium]